MLLVVQETCVGLKTCTLYLAGLGLQPEGGLAFWVLVSQRQRMNFMDSEGQAQRQESLLRKRMKASVKREESRMGCQRSDLVRIFYPFFFRVCSISMLTSCERLHSNWLCLQHSDWLCLILIPSLFWFIHSAFPSFYTLRSQGGHTGGFHGPFFSLPETLWLHT